MMQKPLDLLLTALAPIIWGTTYYVTTELLPANYPITVAMLRALPAGILLLLWVRQLPQGHWWCRILVLGALNFSIFWLLLFVAAYRLPGGVAAVLGATQPILVIFLARVFLNNAINSMAIVAAIAGIFGVALLVLDSTIVLDSWGLAAGITGAISMAFGTVLTRKWQPPVSLLAFTSWQLTAGGLLLLPLALLLEPPLPALQLEHLTGFIWLGLLGAIVSYALWFRGIQRLDVTAVSMLGFFSPLTAVVVGWLLLDQHLTMWQLLGVLMVLSSIWLSQNTTMLSRKKAAD